MLWKVKFFENIFEGLLMVWKVNFHEYFQGLIKDLKCKCFEIFLKDC